MQTIFIKNMVCNRCIKVVKDELAKIGIITGRVTLGEAEILNDDILLRLTEINEVLIQNGFELLDNKQSKLIEKIKLLIIKAIHYKKEEELEGIIFSEYLSEKTELSYQYLSNLFSSYEGITIEKFIINQKIEKAKELIIYNELNLSETAFRLGYKSVQHLSSQFKKVTGLTPSAFKQLREKKRNPIDKV